MICAGGLSQWHSSYFVIQLQKHLLRRNWLLVLNVQKFRTSIRHVKPAQRGGGNGPFCCCISFVLVLPQLLCFHTKSAIPSQHSTLFIHHWNAFTHLDASRKLLNRVILKFQRFTTVDVYCKVNSITLVKSGGCGCISLKYEVFNSQNKNSRFHSEALYSQRRVFNYLFFLFFYYVGRKRVLTF